MAMEMRLCALKKRNKKRKGRRRRRKKEEKGRHAVIHFSPKLYLVS
jgi:hypothetical protein